MAKNITIEIVPNLRIAGVLFTEEKAQVVNLVYINPQAEAWGYICFLINHLRY